jgi:L-fuculose-phosphate aldolase
VVITPSGVEYESLYEGILPLVDLQTGTKVQGRLKQSSETPTHLSIYRARPDVFGVVHTHSVQASAFAVLRESIPALVEDIAQVAGCPVACAEYAPPGTPELGAHLVKALGTCNAALLANHGIVGVGPTIEEALRVCQVVEKGAQIYATARPSGNRCRSRRRRSGACARPISPPTARRPSSTASLNGRPVPAPAQARVPKNR